ncbi:MAG: repressor protein CI [Siphoviridae sp. ctdEk19]|nr:MAG: repressor protein CI [Siphoviridae sp. ctdEk19]
MAAITKLNYTHDALIDAIIARPGCTQRQLAAVFGYSEAWLSQVMSSDSFKAQLALRRAEIIDPALVASVEERFEGVLRLGLDVVGNSLVANPRPEFALKAIDVAARALGFGAKAPQVQVQNNFVAQIPAPIATTGGWLEQVHGTPPAETPAPPAEESGGFEAAIAGLAGGSS